MKKAPRDGGALTKLRPSTVTARRKPLEESSESESDSSHSKRQRNRKNDKQVEVLKAHFDFNRLWTKKEIKSLSEETGLSQSQVYKWRWDYRKKLQADVIEQISAKSFITEEVLFPSQLDWEMYEQQRDYKRSATKEDNFCTPSGLLVLSKYEDSS